MYVQKQLTEEHCIFRPQIFYQEISSWHACEAALDFKMDITRGISQAKYLTEIDLENGPEDRLKAAILSATKCVSSHLVKSDVSVVGKKLLAAASWGNSELLGYMLRSCYCSVEYAVPSLLEASRGGFNSCVQILLDAGVPAASIEPHSRKTAFYAACESGQEEIAALLISKMGSLQEVYTKCDFGVDQSLTAFDVLRIKDMNGVAKRLEAKAAETFREA